MKLYMTYSSPYSRIVRMFLKYYEVSFEESLSLPMDNPKDLLNSNPLGKIPALKVDETTSIFDSRLICEWVSEKKLNSSLFGREFLLEPRLLMYKIYGILDSAVGLTIESRKPDIQQSDFWKDRYKQSILRSLEEIQSSLNIVNDNIFLKISLLSAIDYLSFRHEHLSLMTGLDGLKTWFEKESSLEVFKSTPHS